MNRGGVKIILIWPGWFGKTKRGTSRRNLRRGYVADKNIYKQFIKIVHARNSRVRGYNHIYVKQTCYSFLNNKSEQNINISNRRVTQSMGVTEKEYGPFGC